MKLNIDDGTIKIGQTRTVLHCNHYNTFLQNTLVETLGDKMVDVQIRVAAKICTKLFQELPGVGAEDIQKIFFDMGLGSLNLSEITEGKGRVRNSHYGLNMYYKFGTQGRPVCYLAAGFILAAYNKLTGASATSVEEKECIAMNPEEFECCVFEVRT